MSMFLKIPRNFKGNKNDFYVLLGMFLKIPGKFLILQDFWNDSNYFLYVFDYVFSDFLGNLYVFKNGI